MVHRFHRFSQRGVAATKREAVSHQPSAINQKAISQKATSVEPTSAPRRGRHITAQGRDHRSRTLGQDASRRRTLKGFHTGRADVQPLQGWIGGGHFPRVRSCVATLGCDVQPFRGTEVSGHRKLAQHANILEVSRTDATPAGAVMAGRRDLLSPVDLCQSGVICVRIHSFVIRIWSA